MASMEAYIEEIKDLWDTRWLTNMGDKHRALEAQLLDYLQVPNITLFANGHLGLESIIEALGLKGEVITTPFTFVSTTHAIVRKGLEPVFCDINAVDYTMDADKIESLITDKTSAILPVHVYGHVCQVEQIETIARKYNLKVIYDAAHAFGVKVKGQGIGAFGDASMFSFHATKVFNTIEGGGVTYKDMSLKKKLNDLKNFGITGPESVACVGGNAKMNEFQAAMGICNLRHIDDEIAKRKSVSKRYYDHLEGVEGIRLAKEQEGVDHNYGYMPVVFDGYKMSRDVVFEALKSHEIIPRKYFYPLISRCDCYRDKHQAEATPVALQIAENVLNLPLYADLGLDDVDRICDIIRG
ncbi:DegT/DnrJ/EryC1/StrS family aminotransferase [Petrocella sp. FN5]|uniref:DegT/DnrJ/EryC1/StrS family aminotransferase n=1 Tax=Petrocella sp. FN5 TaxID=3032002 RepID=UPI0023DB6FDA|nr:DegT/DnrJ/EryC1/StrS family aminotransferase [Petrocella sp. FN5]MDF1618117.1 DegT/DnrJ/EryC1/StrS family aminotransferase [Petrocella sp. FN5]